MDGLAFLKTFVVACVLPPGGLVLLVLLGLAIAGRWPRTGRVLASASAIALVLASLPVISTLLVDSLNDAPLYDPVHQRGAGAIVILGGGVRTDSDEYGGSDTLGRLTLERVRYGAWLARETRLPVLVTGGQAGTIDGQTEAGLMRETLEREFRVPVRWVEERAINTRENARNTAALLRKAGIGHVVLVLHGFDVKRARADFEAAGLRVTVAPTLVPVMHPRSIQSWLPSVHALEHTHYAAYEWLALLVRSI
ncbi:MAG TPA: YdcF family protein [Burkholderiaceae bacterium]|nr:YdcF family protein [Burkholderiaceae bacterium]